MSHGSALKALGAGRSRTLRLARPRAAGKFARDGGREVSRPADVILLASPAAGVHRRWRGALPPRCVVHEVADRTALKRSMASLRPAMLLLDLGVPGVQGPEDLPTLQRLSPRTKIVLFTCTPNDKEAISALKAGAKGYCGKDIAPSLLGKAVKRIRKGEIWIGRKVMSDFIEELAARTARSEQKVSTHRRRRLDRLTARQREIAHLIGGGARNKEIGGRLKVTERTVKAHVSAIFRKLGITNRSHLVRLVAEHTLMAP